MEPITAKKHIVEHWDQYGINFKDKDEMVAFLNILQAADENLDTFHDIVCNGYREFMDIMSSYGWESDQDLYESVMNFNDFFTEEEFIEYILDRWADLKEEGYDDPIREIRTWTFDEEISDTKIYKTEDGYVVRVWY